MNRITLDFSHSKGTINPNIYGHFSEHIGGVFYDGLWVGEDTNGATGTRTAPVPARATTSSSSRAPFATLSSPH